jgi:hypothetical protein
MREIQLTKGQTTVVDDHWFFLLSVHGWYAKTRKNGEGFYAACRINGKEVLMHRLITGAKPGQICDHRNGRSLFNLESNLRVCDSMGNARNRGIGRNNTSGVKGVYWDRHWRKWTARIRNGGKQITLGRFDNIEQARRCYDDACVKYHGEFAVPNHREALGKQ